MKHLYAPWRKKYVNDVVRGKREDSPENECVFCSHATEPEKDVENLVLARTKHHLIMLNLYPYNAGHLLISSLEHKKSLEDLSKESRAELIELATKSTDVVKKVLNAEGVNVGLNMGKAAGAGIPGHIHMHILPRWLGDTNFLPLLTDTKQISLDLHEMFKKLKPHFQSLEE